MIRSAAESGCMKLDVGRCFPVCECGWCGCDCWESPLSRVSKGEDMADVICQIVDASSDHNGHALLSDMGAYDPVNCVWGIWGLPR